MMISYFDRRLSVLALQERHHADPVTDLAIRRIDAQLRRLRALPLTPPPARTIPAP